MSRTRHVARLLAIATALLPSVALAAGEEIQVDMDEMGKDGGPGRLSPISRHDGARS